MSRQGPTKGAIESTNEVQRWSSSRAMGLTIRVLVFLAPLAVGYLALRLIGPALWHPSGLTGTVVWLAQAAVVAAALAFLVERASRRVLPLATLFELSMVFPDQAPSRYRRSPVPAEQTARLPPRRSPTNRTARPSVDTLSPRCSSGRARARGGFQPAGARNIARRSAR